MFHLNPIVGFVFTDTGAPELVFEESQYLEVTITFLLYVSADL